MEAKHKNALIVALLAVVFVMAVGYAAFAQQLNITGNATITSRWDVHFKKGSESYQPSSTMGTTPTGSVTVDEGGLTATFSASLISPGDKITYTVPIENSGNINAVLQNITLSGNEVTVQGDNNLEAVSKDGNIKYTVTSPGTSTLTSGGGTANLTIVAEFVDKSEGNDNAFGSSADLTVTLNYVQAQ